MSSLRPLIVVDESRLLRAFAGAPDPVDIPAGMTQLWIRGAPARARAAIATLPYPADLVLTVEEVRDIPYISAVVNTFLVMDALGLAAALLLVTAMLTYLQARQRSQVVSYGLSLRMGMRPFDHARALAVELMMMFASAYGVGVILALVAAAVVTPLLDPLTAIPPRPLFVLPIVVMIATLPILAALSVIGGWYTDRIARRADLGQVMRVAE
jgi:putative ABC transport system permease protein